jgi:SAM-dependent methyltransferase
VSGAAPRLYTTLARWWPLISPPEGYAEEAALYRDLLVAACDGPARTLLELGCGGGHNASHLAPHFALTLTDLSPEMLALSRALNPGVEHHLGDMRTLRLGRAFDCVLIHDAIDYMTTDADLRAALETAWVHLRPGGAALFAPDHVRETFLARTSHGGIDRDGRGARYLEWSYDPDPTDDTITTDYVFALRERDGQLEIVHDRHLTGLFPRDTWLRLLADVGFEPTPVSQLRDDIADLGSEVFVGRRRH